MCFASSTIKVKPKLEPRDIFGTEVQEGDRVVYILKDHGYTVLSWAKIDGITYKDSGYPKLRFTLHCTKYAQKGGWDDNRGKWPQQVRLTRPTMILVGDMIKDYKGV